MYAVGCHLVDADLTAPTDFLIIELLTFGLTDSTHWDGKKQSGWVVKMGTNRQNARHLLQLT